MLVGPEVLVDKNLIKRSILKDLPCICIWMLKRLERVERDVLIRVWREYVEEVNGRNVLSDGKIFLF